MKYGYRILKSSRLGIEVWLLILDGCVLGTFMSENGAKSAKMRHAQLRDPRMYGDECCGGCGI